MSITLELSPEQEALVREAAAKEGIRPGEFVARSVIEDLPQHPKPNTSGNRTLDLLAQWAAEDATDDPEEIRIAEEELQELKDALNESRRAVGARLLFPE